MFPSFTAVTRNYSQALRLNVISRCLLKLGTVDFHIDHS